MSLHRDSAICGRFLLTHLRLQSLYRLLTQRWSPPPWIMHEIRVQITPINMQYSLRWLNCHLIVMNMWKMSGTTYSPPLLILTFFFFPSTWNEFEKKFENIPHKALFQFSWRWYHYVLLVAGRQCRTAPHGPAQARLYVKAVKLVSSSGVVSETSPLAARWLDTIGINHSGELAQVRFMSAP